MLVTYYRVSTTKQGRSGLGLDAQKFAVEDYAKRINTDISDSFTEIESGRCKNRPELNAALTKCRATGSTLVVAKLDRLARDVGLILSLVDSGVPITFLDLPDISADPIVGRLVLTVMAAIAEFESRRIGQRIREALARRRTKLEADGKPLPKRVFSIDHQRKANSGWHAQNRRLAKAFRFEYQPVALGLRQSRTLLEVAAEMNSRGIATRRKRKWTPGLVHYLLK
jgi:DNA invertase Pin-like site-specific DNA recombinase